jgi:hypothetical protein
MNITKVKSIANKTKLQILQCIHYKGRELIYTNSYFLIVETLRQSVEVPFNIHIPTMQIYDGTYPDTIKIRPNEKSLISVDGFEIVGLQESKDIYYNVQNYLHKKDGLFSLTLIKQALGCLNKKYEPVQILNSGNAFLVKSAMGEPLLVFKTATEYVLILGVKKT